MAAERATKSFKHDVRVHHFYDPEQRAGKAIAERLGAEAGKVAWDVYLFYEKEGEWIDEPPMPSAWMHQLVGSRWADAAHHHKGADLAAQLWKTMQELA